MNRCLRWLLFSAVMIGTAAPALAEVSYFRNTTLITGMTDGSDPVGHSVWQSTTGLPAEVKLNLGGEIRRDGRPHVIWHPTTGHPIVTWAYRSGSDHDIAVAHWTDEGWSPIEFVTSGSDDEVDPRVFCEPDGTLRVAYWARNKEEVLIAKRDLDGQWHTPIQVGEGRRPSIASVNGLLRIAFETRMPGDDRFSLALIIEEADDEAFIVETVESTARTGRLDPIIHVAGDRAWIDFKRANDEMGALVFDDDDAFDGDDTYGNGVYPPGGTWLPMAPEPWIDPTWIGTESARRNLLRRVFGN